jgi:hypothetical protein
MPKNDEIRVGRKNSNPTLTPHRAKSVSYEQFKTEMDAKNRAYAFILLCDLYDEFVAFCRLDEQTDPHEAAVNYLCNNLNR